MWTDDQKEQIIREYFRTQSSVRCPDDKAYLKIRHDLSMGPRVTAVVDCPFCKQEFEWEKTERGPQWTNAQKDELVKDYLRGKSTSCSNCGSIVEVETEMERDSRNMGDYLIKCPYCLLFESHSF